LFRPENLYLKHLLCLILYEIRAIDAKVTGYMFCEWLYNTGFLAAVMNIKDTENLKERI
jgi:hypothetical protein